MICVFLVIFGYELKFLQIISIEGYAKRMGVLTIAGVHGCAPKNWYCFKFLREPRRAGSTLFEDFFLPN